MTIALKTPRIETEGDRTIYRVEVDGAQGLPDLWFSVPAHSSALVNSRADAGLVALLMPAMALHEDITIEGVTTDELVWNCKAEVQEVLRRVRPELSRISVEASLQEEPLPPGSGVGTGYSAGVDSYATLARFLFDPAVPEHLRVTHLLYNNVGSHGHGDEGRSLFRQRLQMARPKAQSTGLALIDIDSNVDDIFVGAGLEFQPSHTIRNMAVAHLLSRGIGRYLYASGVSYEDITATPTVDLAFADPLLLPFLSTRALILQPSGTEMDRSAKIDLVSQIPHTYQSLDVCVASTDGANCSECWKCHRTMLTLDLLGALPKYASVFAEPRNPRWRENHIVEALTEDMPSARSVVRLYDDRVGIPPRLRLEARRLEASRFSHRAARAVSRRVRKVLRPRN